MSELTYRIDNDLLDINCEGRDHVNDEELEHLGNSIINIGLRASTLYEDLRIKKAPISEAALACYTPDSVPIKARNSGENAQQVRYSYMKITTTLTSGTKTTILPTMVTDL